MDIQDKLSIYKGDKLFQEIDLRNLGLNTILFEIFESDIVYLTNESSDYEVIIEVGEDIDSNFSLMIGLDKTLVNTKDYPRAPMDYQIIVFNKITKHADYRFYRINPLKAVQKIEYENLISYLAQKNQSLLIDEYGLKKTGSIISTKINYPQYIAASEYLVEKNEEILYCISEIIENTDFYLKKGISIDNEYKKQNSRTLIKNVEKFDNQHFYNVSYKKDYLTSDNFKLYSSLSLIILSFSNIKTQIDKKRDFLSKRIIEIQKYNSENKYDNAITSIQNKLFHIDNNLTKLDKIIKSVFLLKEHLESFNLGNNSLSFTGYKNNLYKYFDELIINPIFNTYSFSFGGLFGNRYAMQIKNTSKLFEYYCFYVIVDAIKSFGFIELFDEDTIDLETVKSFEFEFDNYKVLLKYDCEALNFDDFSIPDLYSINSKRNKPDFSITIFKNKNFVANFIIDAKCKKLSDVKKDAFKSGGSLRQTVFDYMSLRYLVNKDLNGSSSYNEVLFVIPAPISSEYSDSTVKAAIKNVTVDGFENDFTNYLWEHIFVKI